MVRVEAGDRQRRLACNRSNIFLIDHAVLIYHERANSGYSIFRGPRHQTEPANKLTFNEVIVRSFRRIGALPIENAKIVSVVRFGLSLLRTVPGGPGETLGYQRLARAFPIQPVLPAGRTHETGGVLQHYILVAILRSILHLRLDVPVANFDSIKFVSADAPDRKSVV